MLLKIACPHCRKDYHLPVREAYRGNRVACPHCDGEQMLGGQVLADIFWVFNLRERAR